MPHLQLRDLQTRYYDWCSARIAERILALSPEELQSLGERYSETEATPAPVAAPGSFASAGVHALAEGAIRAVQAELRLPSFEGWLEEYRGDPERFDRDLIGLYAPRPSGEHTILPASTEPGTSPTDPPR